MHEFDIAVIGVGAAGLSVAAGAAQLGARVALISRDPLGGDCLHYGCVPSKSLIHVAALAHRIHQAGELGLDARLGLIDLGQVSGYVRRVIQAIAPNDSPERFRSLGAEVIFGQARFRAPDTLVVDQRIIRARRFVIATGSRPAIPAIAGLEQTPYLTNETIFSVSGPVEHLLVLGGGPIGCELAQAFRRLGSRVTLVSHASRLLPREDEDLSSVIQQRFQEEGISFFLEAHSRSAKGDGVTLDIETPSGPHRLQGSHLLVATGRRRNLENLGLEQAGVAVERGRLVLDDRLRTTNRRIYACGDAAGPFLFTHMAEHQATVVLKNALFHWPARVERRVVPWCTFTDPELARVGLSEREAKSRGVEHRVYRCDFSAIDRAVTMNETQGFAKVVATPRGRILGAAIVGPQAGELIHEYVLAMRAGLKLGHLSNTIHIYPTLSQINRRVADERLRQALTPTRRRWLKRLFRLRGKP